ncbi:auxin-responsive protein SAUR36-like [Musa acuminata AAA Group]|uniref:auxin-responsive protein SAUR36-like n=1 Tax=Musa acuminata AAA Group TaxID=214697 RepID=UPI0031D31A64
MSLPLPSPHARREKEWMSEPSLFSSSLGHQPTPLAVTMKRYRGGFRLGRRLVRIWRRVFRLEGGYHRRPGPAPSSAISNARRRIESSAVATRLFDWGRSLSRRLRRRGEDRAPLLEEDAWGPPPKGHLAVYVGGGQPRRYVVPVIYFNHPLFGELLREAEEEFGFQHPGGITIPCPAAKFERVRTRIAAAGCHLRRKSSSSRFLPL